MTEKYLLGISIEKEDEPTEVGSYTVADQALAFGVPEEELTDTQEDVPPAGMPRKFWKDLGVG